MAKLKLDPDPTFDADVNIPVPGADPVPVRFTFKRRTKDEMLAWIAASVDDDEVKTIKDICTGWELDDKFDDKGIRKLCQNYIGSAQAVTEVYLNESRGARAKN